MAVAFLTLVLRSLEFFRDAAEEARKLLVCIVRGTARARKFRQSFRYIKQGCLKIRGTRWKSRLLLRATDFIH